MGALFPGGFVAAMGWVFRGGGSVAVAICAGVGFEKLEDDGIGSLAAIGVELELAEVPDVFKKA